MALLTDGIGAACFSMASSANNAEGAMLAALMLLPAARANSK